MTICISKEQYDNIYYLLENLKVCKCAQVEITEKAEYILEDMEHPSYYEE